MKQRIGFTVYRDWREVLNDFDDKLYRELMEAILDLGLDKVENNTSPLVQVALKLIKPQILRDWQKFEATASRSKENGSKGGRPKKQPDNPAGFKRTQKTQSVFEVTDNKNENQKPTGPNNEYNIMNINNENNIKEEINSSLSTDVDSEEKIAYQDFIDFYNQCAVGRNIIKCVKLTERRKKAIKARVREYGSDEVFKAITKCANSSFCNGHNTRNWKADFDFVFNANKMARLLEGKYDNNALGTNSFGVSQQEGYVWNK